MPQLCANRPEGFGPHSSLHGHLPTSCFLDTIVVPLSTWIYLVLLLFILLPLAIAQHMRHKNSVPESAIFNPEDTANSGEDAKYAHPRRRRGLLVFLRVLYYFLLLATTAMISLEIARLESGSLGIGLLPFQYVGVVIAGAVNTWLVIRRSKRATRSMKGPGLLVEKLGWAFNILFWVMLTVGWVLKVATYVEEGVHSRDDMVPQDAYSVVDEVTDLGVLVLLGVIGVVLESLGSAGLA